MTIFPLLCLLPLAACTTAADVVVAPKMVRPEVPAALIASCPKPDRRPWRVTRDIVLTAAANEAALKQCSAQVDGVRAWNEGQK